MQVNHAFDSWVDIKLPGYMAQPPSRPDLKNTVQYGQAPPIQQNDIIRTSMYEHLP
jgi:hypothetical protein